jgi:predicted transporter
MEILSILMQVGILSAVLVFGIKVGLASGLANISKKYLAAICIAYGAGVLILSKVASYYTSQLTNLIYTYNSGFFIIMAAIMIVAGVLTIREYKVHNKNTTAATCMVVIAPCPCCFGVIIATILLLAPTVSIGVFILSEYVAVALVATILISYFASNTIVKFIKKPYPIILGNFELFLGVYFLLSAIVLPNIATALSKQFSGINIQSFNSLFMFIVLALILIIIGYIMTKKSTLLD